MHTKELKLALKDYLKSLEEANAAFGWFMLDGNSSEWLDARADQDYHLIKLMKIAKEDR